METPPAPPGWNKTIDDLMAEMTAGRRKSIGFPEVDWARDYERSLLPKDTRFPRKGDVYDPLAPVEVSFMTQWSAPRTGGGMVTLRPGQHIRIDDDPAFEQPITVYAVAVNYKELERLAVPWWTRLWPGYLGFALSVKTELLVGKFRLISSEKAAP